MIRQNFGTDSWI